MSWWAMVFLIASEVLFFANMIVAYLYLRVRAGEWPPPGVPELDTVFPTINTIILLCSALPMHGAHLAIRRGDRRGMTIGLGLASLLGIIFMLGQAYEYTNLYAEGFTPASGTVGSTFFALTGFHGAHVLVGILIMLVCFFRSLGGAFTKERHFAVEGAAMYWHFVDAVWIIVFAVVYLL